MCEECAFFCTNKFGTILCKCGRLVVRCNSTASMDRKVRLEEGAAVIYALATLHCKKKKLTENSDTEEAKNQQ